MRIGFAGVRGVPALYSGFETAVTEIGARLVERGHEVVCYCRNGYGDASQPACRGIRKIYLPRLNVKMADTLSHTALSFLHAAVHPVDVLIVMNPANGPLCLIPRLRGIPFAVNVDGLEWRRAKWPALGRLYLYLASWFCTKIAPEIIADSRCIQEFYRERFGRKSFFAAYGTSIERSTRPEVLEGYGLEKDGYFLVVARLEPENNTDLVIESFRRVRTDKKLVIVGGVNYKSRYVARLRQTDDPRVVFMGAQYDEEKLTELFCNSFAYVHGHMVGGTNPVLLKALGCGACVLYLDVNFNAEVVQDAGLPFARSAEAAAAVFQQVVDNPDVRSALCRRGPERVRDAYSWDAVTDRYEELCRRLVAGERQAAEDSPAEKREVSG